MSTRVLLALVLGLVVALGGMGCSEDGGGFLPDVPDGGDDDDIITTPTQSSEWLAAARLEGVSGTYSTAAQPTGSGNAPLLVGSHQIVRAGSLVLELTIDDSMTDLYIAVSNADLGYYRVDLQSLAKMPSGSATGGANTGAAWKIMKTNHRDQTFTALRAPASYTLSVTSHNDPTLSGFTLRVSAGNGQQISAASTHAVTVNGDAASSSQLQVSLNWTQDVDLDVHVQIPTGQDIYWANRTAGGGTLDLDSNAGCFLDHIRNENITWGSTAPFAGEYVVRADLWSACDLPGPFPYVVTVTIDGEPQIFEGSFTAADEDFGGALSGREITRFTLDIAP